MGTRYIVMIATLVVFLLWMLYIGLKTRKWIDSMDDYLVAGREIGTVVLALGLFSIIAAGTTFSGATGLGYSHGMGGAIWGLSWAFAALIGAIFFTPLIRASGGYTLAEWMGMSYGLKTQVVISLPQVIGSICSGAAQIIGSAFILCGLTGWSYLTAVLVSGLVVLAYTYLGGLWAVAYTELIQGIFCIGGIIITLGYLMISHGGFGYLTASLPADYFTYPGKLGWGLINGNWGLLTALGCTWGYVMIVIPNTYIWTKIASSRSIKTASNSFLIAAVLCVLFLTWPIAMIGMYGKAIGLQLENSQMVFGAIIKQLPIGLDAIVLVGIVSAVMSTASGAALGAGASAVRDLFQAPFRPNAEPGELVKPTRIITFLCWTLIIILAISLEKIGTLQMLGLAFAYYSVTFPIFVASFYYPKIHKEAAFWSCAISLVITTIYVFSMKWMTPPYFIHPMWVGTAITTVLMVVINTVISKTASKSIDVDSEDCDRVLRQIAKGRNQLVYLVDFIGKEGKYTQTIVEKLVQDGFVKRQSGKGMGYQMLDLTDKGITKCNYRSSIEKEIVNKYGVSLEDLQLIERISEVTKGSNMHISFENKTLMNQLIENRNISFKELKNLIMFLNAKGMLNVKGIMRLNFKLNSRSDKVLSEYADAFKMMEAGRII